MKFTATAIAAHSNNHHPSIIRNGWCFPSSCRRQRKRCCLLASVVLLFTVGCLILYFSSLDVTSDQHHSTHENSKVKSVIAATDRHTRGVEKKRPTENNAVEKTISPSSSTAPPLHQGTSSSKSIEEKKKEGLGRPNQKKPSYAKIKIKKGGRFIPYIDKDIATQVATSMLMEHLIQEGVLEVMEGRWGNNEKQMKGKREGRKKQSEEDQREKSNNKGVIPQQAPVVLWSNRDLLLGEEEGERPREVSSTINNQKKKKKRQQHPSEAEQYNSDKNKNDRPPRLAVHPEMFPGSQKDGGEQFLNFPIQNIAEELKRIKSPCLIEKQEQKKIFPHDVEEEGEEKRRSANFNSSTDLFHRPRRPEIHICAVIRNRARLLVEWLLWYRLLGVSHFWIYVDDLTDSVGNVYVKSYLRPFIAAKMVTLRSVRGALKENAMKDTSDTREEEERRASRGARMPIQKGGGGENTEVDDDDDDDDDDAFQFWVNPPQQGNLKKKKKKKSGPLLPIYGHCFRQIMSSSHSDKDDGVKEDKSDNVHKKQGGESADIANKNIWVGIIDPDEFLVLEHLKSKRINKSKQKQQTTEKERNLNSKKKLELTDTPEGNNEDIDGRFCVSTFLHAVEKSGVRPKADREEETKHNNNDRNKKIYKIGAVAIPWVEVGHQAELTEEALDEKKEGGKNNITVRLSTIFERSHFAPGFLDPAVVLYKLFVRLFEDLESSVDTFTSSRQSIIEDMSSAHYVIFRKNIDEGGSPKIASTSTSKREEKEKGGGEKNATNRRKDVNNVITKVEYVTVMSDGSIVAPETPRGDGVWLESSVHLSRSTTFAQSSETGARKLETNLLQTTRRSSMYSPSTKFSISHHQRQLLIHGQGGIPGARLLHYHSRSFRAWLQRKLDGYSDQSQSKNVVDVHDIFEQWCSTAYWKKGFLKEEEEQEEKVEKKEESTIEPVKLLEQSSSSISRPSVRKSIHVKKKEKPEDKEDVCIQFSAVTRSLIASRQERDSNISSSEFNSNFTQRGVPAYSIMSPLMTAGMDHRPASMTTVEIFHHFLSELLQKFYW